MWAMKHWMSEIRGGYPLLRAVSEQIVLEIMESLSADERISFGGALAKRGYPAELLSAWGYPLSTKERKFQNLYLNMIEGIVSGRLTLKKPRGRVSAETLSQKQRRRLKAAIVKALNPVLGAECENWGGWKEWRYCTPVGPWQVVTYVDIGGGCHELCYEHDVIAAEDAYLAENVNLLRWLGIASQTQWHGLSDSDIEPTARSLAKIIAYFVNAAPTLLDGLSPD